MSKLFKPCENLISGVKMKKGRKNCNPAPISNWKSWGDMRTISNLDLSERLFEAKS
jgi:hypothetical protein